MELSGKWWRSDVALEVHATLTDRERARKRVFQGRSPQLTYRRQLVDWITSIAERHKLCLSSLHLAVYLLDFFMDNFDVSRNQLNLVAMGCVSVATKFEEKEEDIPKQTVLSNYCGGAYAASDFLQMELMLLKFFDWEVGLVTPAHYINFYVHFTCAEVDIDDATTDTELIEQRNQIRDSVKSYSRYFMSVCIQYHHFHDYPPSVIAAASICATRFCLNLVPVFPLQLQNINSFSETQLLACQRDLLLIHDRDKNRTPEETESKRPKPETSTPEGTPDGGHVSTNKNRHLKDDSVYHSDCSVDDSDPDSLQMDTATMEEKPAVSCKSSSSRIRSPSCSPIRGPTTQPPPSQLRRCDQQPQYPQRHLRRNGVSVGSSEEDEDEEMEGESGMAEEESSYDDRARYLAEGGVGETVEINTNNDMMYTSMSEVNFSINKAAPLTTQTTVSATFNVDREEDDDREVVDLVDDDDDSCEDVVVISEGRGTKMTDDSGVGFVAEDLGAEEECYEEVAEDGEVFIEELQPTIHPSIRRTTADNFVYVEKPLNAPIFPQESESRATASDAFVSNNGTFRVVSVPILKS